MRAEQACPVLWKLVIQEVKTVLFVSGCDFEHRHMVALGWGGEGERISDALDSFSLFFGSLEISATILAEIVACSELKKHQKKVNR